jgi:hypothetical protein
VGYTAEHRRQAGELRALRVSDTISWFPCHLPKVEWCMGRRVRAALTCEPAVASLSLQSELAPLPPVSTAEAGARNVAKFVSHSMLLLLLISSTTC